MKILFIVTGFGYGDSVRINSIIDEIKRLKPGSKFLILGYSSSYDYFNPKYPTLKIKGYKFPDRDMKFSASKFLIKNFYLPTRWFGSFKKHRRTIINFDPDVVVSDFEPLGVIIARKLGIRCISIFGFNPRVYENYPHKNMITNIQAKYLSKHYEESDLVIIPSFVKQKNSANLIYVNPIVRKYKLKDSKKILKELKLTKKPLLVMLGGSNYGIKLAKEIGRINQKLKQEIIMFGGKEQIPYLHYVKFKENFLDYLNVSSGVITLAGNLTLSECLSFKKPALVFPIKNHVEQLMNAHSLKDIFQIEYNLNNLEKAMRTFIRNKDKISNKLKNINIRPVGATEAAKIILKEVKR
ncbi:MAG: glycosyltransferase family protein [Candidatus Nanoarchaeia archaeon]|nr:glycosyltransferase family protein [Candidatus Nanoarchaeia archaeon]